MHKNLELLLIVFIVNTWVTTVQAAQQPVNKTSDLSRLDRLTGRAVHVRQIKIMDNAGFKIPVPAYQMMIPAGWETRGGVVWKGKPAGGCGVNIPYLSWSATASDGIAQVSMLPQETWAGVENKKEIYFPDVSGCTINTTKDIRKLVEAYAKRLRPNARVISYRHRPDIAKLLQLSLDQQSKKLTDNYPQVRQWANAGQVVVAYTVKGFDVLDMIVIAAIFMRPAKNSVVNIQVLPGFSMRMRKEYFDEKMAELIRRSFMGVSAYTGLMSWYYKQLYFRKQESPWMMNERLIDKSEKERRRIKSRYYKHRLQSMPVLNPPRKCNEKRKVFPDDVAVYKSPGSPCNKVQFRNSYKYVWGLVDGTFVLTDSVSFNPLSAVGIKGKRLRQLNKETIK